MLILCFFSDEGEFGDPNFYLVRGSRVDKQVWPPLTLEIGEYTAIKLIYNTNHKFPSNFTPLLSL